MQRQSKKRQGKVLVDDDDEDTNTRQHQSADATALGTVGAVEDDAVSLMSVGPVTAKPTGIAALIAP